MTAPTCTKSNTRGCFHSGAVDVSVQVAVELSFGLLGPGGQVLRAVASRPELLLLGQCAELMASEHRIGFAVGEGRPASFRFRGRDGAPA